MIPKGMPYYMARRMLGGVGVERGGRLRHHPPQQTRTHARTHTHPVSHWSPFSVNEIPRDKSFSKKKPQKTELVLNSNMTIN